MTDQFDEFRKSMGADVVNTFLANFGMGPKYISKNLLKLSTVSSTGIHALGDGSSNCSAANDFSPSLKKESNGKFIYSLKR